MNKKDQLLKRLDEIGESLAKMNGALLLLGLGSVGVETDRLDDYSDLDFFVIVAPGYKRRYIENLDWLEQVRPLVYSFQNTADGSKIMFNDGIYGEYAVFEERDLRNIPHVHGRVVWKDPLYKNTDVGANLRQEQKVRIDSLDHPLNEALTNLYVGLTRYARGEKMSATRFIQGYAVDSIISVLHLLEKENKYFPDPFVNERRLEVRFPNFSQVVGKMVLGYNRVPESALHILDYVASVYPVNQRLAEEIRSLADKCISRGQSCCF
ncbi:hypothetical protein [Alicyclobacillus sp. SO9]|uniref:hypothetical protein n=1 Tax=Alicyclobacillus sp. SO9 TaxID=2665646 RepID=UPI0018E74F46|nr:hypothetical protein [Alicyclobacillus sp. SO9]QQE77235.1 hypothetical protein GI364_14840 [Alicyclobacillus sp. SO9]